MRLYVGLAVFALMAWGSCSVASAAGVTPGWECVPTTAGLPVTSGGAGPSPSCSSGTAVLAPTYVASGVGGKPTVEFSTVNLQVVSGSGSTSGTVNGEGNLIVGYAENPNNHKQTGSNDLVVGINNGWSGYGELVGGANNQASGDYATAFGATNTASGEYSLAAGHVNTPSGFYSTAIGGEYNTASGFHSSITGGEYNRATDQFSSITGGCSGLAGAGQPQYNTCASSGFESVTGGQFNVATDLFSSISGGCDGQAGSVSSSTANAVKPDDYGSGPPCTSGAESISGGQNNDALDPFTSVAGGCDNVAGTGDVSNGDYDCAPGNESTIGGDHNDVTGQFTSISGGQYGHASGVGSAISGGNGNTVSSTASISGGDLNTASGSSSISGGQSNTASGYDTAIAGGLSESLSTEYDTRAGNTVFGP